MRTVENGSAEAAPIAIDKPTFAARWGFSKRMVDVFLAAGLPHVKFGKRRVRIITTEGDAWIRETYGRRRIGPEQTVADPLQPSSAATPKPSRKPRQPRKSA